MTQRTCLKILGLYLIAYLLASSSEAFEKEKNTIEINQKKSPASSWAHQQIETNRAQGLAGDHRPLIAIIDTGVDISHPSLKESLWTNPGETGFDSQGRNKATNGIDDDQNGFIDDVHGWNFVTNSAGLKDQNGHGTHVAGIIASVSPQAQMMILKYYDARSTPEQNVTHTFQAFQYAIRMKAQIINFSGGGPGASLRELAILKIAEKNKILLVAAAGNDGVNTDKLPYFPADYPLSNILSVTALNSLVKVPEFANFGAHSVSIAAPGEEIRSSLPGGGFGEMSGTSQATAFASGVAALILSQSSLEPAQVIEKIIGSGVEEKVLQNKTVQATRLDAYRSLAMKGQAEAAEGFQFENRTSVDSSTFTITHSVNSALEYSSVDPASASGNALPFNRESTLGRNQL